MKKSLINFYEKNIPNIHGKNLEDILKMDFNELEKNHNYIQYLFPTFKKSSWNILAPTLDMETLNYFRKSNIVKENVKLSFLLMLSFYGFSYKKENDYYKCVLTNKDRLNIWITKNNHNFKRITRILTFLKLMEFNEEADAFYSALYSLSLDYKELENALIYWQEAIS